MKIGPQTGEKRNQDPLRLLREPTNVRIALTLIVVASCVVSAITILYRRIPKATLTLGSLIRTYVQIYVETLPVIRIVASRA
jgi:hypothetical protein